MKFGYARISTPKQSLENQIANLEAAGCERIFSDVISGYDSTKKEFEKMKELLRKGDILVVTGIDRLGRSTRDLSHLLESFHEKGIHLQILGHEDLDTRTSHGRMLFNVMALIAENERMRNIERIHQALIAAKRRGKQIGRPKKLEEKHIKRMVEIYKSKQLRVKELCLMYNLCKKSFYNYVNNEK